MLLAKTKPPKERDYVSPNLEMIFLDDAFPNMIVGDKHATTWPHLRRKVTHVWYVDRRDPTIGFVNRDEAAILYNSAKRVAGRACLEIGCWRGWSTAHIARGSGCVEVIDPLLADSDFLADIQSSMQAAGVVANVHFHAGKSPEMVHSLSRRSGKRWSLVFIDGDHDNGAPLADATAVNSHLAEDCLVLFHDLVSTHVAAGLDFFRDNGWNTMVYNTMQIMGVAWRGDIKPVEHQPDLAQKWSLPKHLQGYRIAGEAGCKLFPRVTGRQDRHGEDSLSASADSELLECFDALHSKHMDLIEKLQAAELRHAEDQARILELRAALGENVREELGKRMQLLDELSTAETRHAEKMREVETRLQDREVRLKVLEWTQTLADQRLKLLRIERVRIEREVRQGRFQPLSQSFRSVFMQTARLFKRTGLNASRASLDAQNMIDQTTLSLQSLFDLDYYLGTNTDVRAAGLDPLDHYLNFGWREGRDPSPGFSTNFYLETYPDVQAAQLCPLVHYALCGAMEGRLPAKIPETDPIRLRVAAFFDNAFYLAKYPELKGDLLGHYLTYGWLEGRDPSANFETNFYLEEYPDVRVAAICPLVHYAIAGAREGRTTKRPRINN